MLHKGQTLLYEKKNRTKLIKRKEMHEKRKEKLYTKGKT